MNTQTRAPPRSLTLTHTHATHVSQSSASPFLLLLKQSAQFSFQSELLQPKEEDDSRDEEGEDDNACLSSPECLSLWSRRGRTLEPFLGLVQLRRG